MSDTRTIWCSACGTRLALPPTVRVATPVRCGHCTVVFPVPPVPPTEAPKRSGARVRRAHTIHPHGPTPAQQYDIAELPTGLRRDMEDFATDPEVLVKPDEATDPTRPSLSALSAEEAERRAFDLDRSNDPQKRTGAGIHRILSVPEED